MKAAQDQASASDQQRQASADKLAATEKTAGSLEELGPKLEAITSESGDVVDVAISYPLDLTRQMLEYSAATRHLRT